MNHRQQQRKQPHQDGQTQGDLRAEKDNAIGQKKHPVDLPELESQLKLLTSTVETSNQAITIVNPQGKLILANQKALTLVQTQAKPQKSPNYDLLWQHLTDYEGQPIAEKDLPLNQIISTGQSISDFPCAFEQPDNGGRVFLMVNGTPLFSDEQQLEAVILTYQEVTEAHLQERALQATKKQLEISERRFRTTFEQAAVGIAHIAPDGRFLLVNAKFSQIVGYHNSELVNLTLTDITHPEDIEVDRQYFQKILRGEIANFSREKRYLRPNGNSVWTKLTVALVRDEEGKPDYFITMVEDISSGRRIEEELWQSKQRINSLIQAAAIVMIVLSPSHRIIEWNQEAERLYGYKKSEVLGQDYSVLFLAQPEREKLATEIEKVLSEGKERNFEHLVKIRKGEQRWMLWNLSCLYNKEGKPIAVIKSGQDITQRKQAEVTLRENEERFRSIFNQAGVGIVQVSLAGKLILFNQKFADILAYEPQKLRQKKLSRDRSQ